MGRLVVCICALVLLGACQRDPGGMVDAASQARQLAQYKQTVIPLLAGSYRGSCTGGDAKAPRTIVIDSAGVARAPGWTADLLNGTEVLILSRTLDDPGSLSVQVGGAPAASAPAGRSTPGLPVDPTGQIHCAYGGNAHALAKKSLYAFVAPYFKRGSSTLICTSLHSSEQLKVQASDDGIQVGKRTLSFVQGVQTEHIYLHIKGAKLSYAVEYASEIVGVTVDGSGNISDVTTGGTQDSFGCTPAGVTNDPV